MIVWLVNLLFDEPAQTKLRLFTYVEFRAVLAAIMAFVVVVALGKRTIKWLLTQKIGDNPEFDHADLNELMKSKANTPTMGGLLMVAAIFGVTLLLADFTSFYVVLALVCLLWMCAIGVADDWLKLTTARRSPGSRVGLRSHEKLLFQLGGAAILAVFAYGYAATQSTAPDPESVLMARAFNFPFLKSWVYENHAWVPASYLVALSPWIFVPLGILFITGGSNAVNLTDGMDGLASGVMVIVAFAFMILCIIAGYHDEQEGFTLAKELLVPHIPGADELAIVAGAMAGACVGFLWFNCSPAQVFMGDSGSLPLGGLIAFIAVVIRQELLLVLIGGVFVMEMFSVILQVGYFKFTGGKRIFKCAPIHHHFHLKGWTEQQVVIRFWLITMVLAAIALVSIRLR